MARHIQLRDFYVTPDGKLKGLVHGDWRFNDGQRVETSRVQSSYSRGVRLFARTHNTRYELTGPDGQPWHTWAEPGDLPPIEARR